MIASSKPNNITETQAMACFSKLQNYKVHTIKFVYTSLDHTKPLSATSIGLKAISKSEI